MNKHVRSLEELVTLQDKAIDALNQANLALQLALDALQQARAEVGYAHRMFPSSYPIYTNPPMPNQYTGPFTVPNGWTSGGSFVTVPAVTGPISSPGFGSGSTSGLGNPTITGSKLWTDSDKKKLAEFVANMDGKKEKYESKH